MTPEERAAAALNAARFQPCEATIDVSFRIALRMVAAAIRQAAAAAADAEAARHADCCVDREELHALRRMTRPPSETP